MKKFKIFIRIEGPTLREGKADCFPRRRPTVPLTTFKSLRFQFTLKKSAANYCTGSGVVKCPDTRVYITSSIPISVIANNYLNKAAGDSFTVMPVTMAGTQYAVTVPEPKSRRQSSTVYFVALEKATTVNLQIVDQKRKTQTNKTITISASAKEITAFRTGSAKYLFASGNADFLIIVAVQSLESPSAGKSLDFGAYMPTPVLSTDCDNTEDYHISMLVSSTDFYAVQPTPQCKCKINVVGGSEYNMSYTVPSKIHIPFASYSSNAGFYSRYGIFFRVSFMSLNNYRCVK
ncbi:unnamed protein product [Gongylonema pulchrum]|uniref:IgGFc_binding domain-containing protein n=1 Tax=Gongylonema pulchrum TaxID=637853 RepID=A0A183CYY5_9BILA|nr:unnamed protein product [Gongylonema pulchrum]